MSAGVVRVGFVGLGDQGLPMAKRIVAGGYETTLWARRSESLEPFRESAGRVASSPAELGAGAELVEICVTDDAGVREVLSGPDGVLAGMRPGGVVAVHSTVHPDTCQEMAALGASAGVSVIEAPVSGGRAAADQGRLLVMLGGDEAAAERCRAVFETYGDPVIFVGPLGAAMAVKLVNNAMMAAHLALAADALDLGLRLGIPPGTTGRCLGHGSGASFSLQVLTMVGDLGNMANAGPLLRKDLTILTELAEAAGAPMGLLEPLADEALARMGIARRDQTPSG